MYILLIFGIGMIGIGCFMVGKPMQFSIGIVQFSEKPWFHMLEIVSRGIFGALLLLVADSTAYSTFVAYLGGLLCFVCLFLIMIGPTRHRQIALLTSGIGKNFRSLGLVAVASGTGLIYLGLAQNA